MDSPDLNQASRRQNALDSLRVVDAAVTEAEVRSLLEIGIGSLNEWDERFPGFVREHRDETLLRGTAGEGIHFVFSAEARAGFWLVARPELRGKGFFSPVDIERLCALARERQLIRE